MSTLTSSANSGTTSMPRHKSSGVTTVYEEDDILLREQVMSSTVSVDDYFDELISQVRKDYASL